MLPALSTSTVTSHICHQQQQLSYSPLLSSINASKPSLLSLLSNPSFSCSHFEMASLHTNQPKLLLLIFFFLTCFFFSLSSGAASEFQALMAFRRAVGNPKAISDWGASPSPCSWRGITCGIKARKYNVVSLALPHLGLGGRLITQSLVSLRHLQHLNLADNRLSGPIPEIWRLPGLRTVDLSFNRFNGSLSLAYDIQKLKMLRRLDLSGNALTGVIEPALAVSIRVLNLGSNSFTGSIPSSIGNLSELRVLDLSSCFISGDIPTSIGDLKNLRYLDVSNNSITGMVPASIGRLIGLRDLLVGNNKLIGPLPREIGNLKRLVNFHAPSAGLQGPIPGEIGDMESVGVIDLSGNPLHAPIPESIGKLQSLTILNLAGAGINGTIPPELGHCRKLKSLSLAFNDLSGTLPNTLAGLSESILSFSIEQNRVSGEIPAWIGAWRNTDSILLGSNQFHGRIPPELGNCSSLTYLSLSHNQLTGSIPSDLCNSKFLYELDLEDNSLTGTIHDTFQNCRNLTQLALSQNQLTGTVPSYLSKLPLMILELDYNNFTGVIPDDIWSSNSLLEFSAGFNFLTGSLSGKIGDLVTLERLILNNNRLEGLIPKEIGKLESLLVLSLNQNQLTGEIPPNLFKCKSITSLDLGSNKFTGKIPKSIGELKELECLVLSHNRLSGNIPIEIAEGFKQRTIPETSYFQHRGILDLSSNELSGLIPGELGSCTVIVDLLLGNNNFSGDIPASILRLPDLVSLDLSSNHLHGKIPLEVKFSNKLQGLSLAFNYIEGNIPSEIGELKSLVKLNLSGNMLTGEIPASVGELRALSDLDLSNNRLSGALPSSLSKLANIVGLYLNYLDLHKNEFTGTITKYFSNLSQLQYLDLSENFLRGRIPAGLCQLTDLVFLDLSSNQLTGEVEDCGKFKSTSFLNNNLPKQGSRLAAILVLSLGAPISVICLISALFKWKTVLCDTMKPNMHATAKTETTLEMDSSFKKPLLQLPQSELMRITNNFSKANVIGDGGSGTVYKGSLNGRIVAIKKLGKSRDQGNREFVAEMESIGKIKHGNLVPLLGYCSSIDEKILIYAFMPNGSLELWLRNKSDSPKTLDWKKRFKIAIGTARGIAFLHHGIVPNVIHRDIKASNILLDHDFEPRLSDFGLARIISPWETHVTTEIAGTFGYIAPEYAQSWRYTTLGDVYSFGVIILEMVTGKEPTGPSFKDIEGGNLVGWVRKMIAAGKNVESLDATVSEGNLHVDQMLELLKLGLVCTSEDPTKRPSMKEVVQYLVQTQQNN